MDGHLVRVRLAGLPVAWIGFVWESREQCSCQRVDCIHPISATYALIMKISGGVEASRALRRGEGEALGRRAEDADAEEGPPLRKEATEPAAVSVLR